MVINPNTMPCCHLIRYRLHYGSKHPLRGDLKGCWAIDVSGNWRVIFRLEAGDVYDVDLVDYH